MLPNGKDNQDEMRQTMFNPPASSQRTGRSAQPNIGAEYSNPMEMVQSGLKTMDKMAGIKQKPERFPNRTYNEGYKSSTLQGAGDPMQLGHQPVNAQQVLPVQQQPNALPVQQTPEMRSDPMMPVNLAETATQQPGYVNPEQVAQLRNEQQLPGDQPVQQMQNYGGQQLPGGQPGQTSFDNDYMNRTYGDNRTTNEERFERNRQDALKQDQASGEMVARINRGTKAMQELSDMRNPGAKMGSLPGSGDYVPVSPSGLGKTDRKLEAESERQSMISKVAADKNARETEKNKILGQQETTKQQFEKQKYFQGRADKEGEFDSKIANRIGQKMNHPDYMIFLDKINNAQSEQVKEEYLLDFKKWSGGIPMSAFEDFLTKQTKPRADELSLANLPK